MQDKGEHRKEGFRTSQTISQNHHGFGAGGNTLHEGRKTAKQMSEEQSAANFGYKQSSPDQDHNLNHEHERAALHNQPRKRISSSEVSSGLQKRMNTIMDVGGSEFQAKMGGASHNESKGKNSASKSGSSAVPGQNSIKESKSGKKATFKTRKNSTSSDENEVQNNHDNNFIKQGTQRQSVMGENKNDQQKMKVGTLIKPNNTGTVTSQQARNAILDKVLLSQMHNIQNMMSANTAVAAAQDPKTGKDGSKQAKNLGGTMFGKLAEVAKKTVLNRSAPQTQDAAGSDTAGHQEATYVAAKPNMFGKIVNQVQKANMLANMFGKKKDDKSPNSDPTAKKTLDHKHSTLPVNPSSKQNKVTPSQSNNATYQQSVTSNQNTKSPQSMPNQQQQSLIKNQKRLVAAAAVSHMESSKQLQNGEKSPQNLGKPKADIKFEESSDSFGTDESFEQDEDEEEEEILEDVRSPKEDDKDKTKKRNSRNSVPRKTDDELAKQFIRNSTNYQMKKVSETDPLNKFLRRSTVGIMDSDIKNLNLGGSPQNYPLASPNSREADENLITPEPNRYHSQAAGVRQDYLTTDGGRDLATEGPIMEFQQETGRPLLTQDNGVTPLMPPAGDQKNFSKRGSILVNMQLAQMGIETINDDQGKGHAALSVVNKVKNFFRLNEINSGDGGFGKKERNQGSKDHSSYDDYETLENSEGQRLRDIHKEASQMCILFPDDPIKIKWEMMISVILIFTAVTTPLRLAFSESDDFTWTLINNMVDSLFGIDIIICFFSAFEDENEELVYNRKIIAMTYIKSWFFIDLMSIVPVSELMETGDFSNLARIARLPKLYRLIRMVKLIRIVKIVKERNNISKYLNEVLKVSVALERLSFFCFIFMMLVHIISCFWVIISTFEEDDDNLIMRNGMMDYESTELYLACFYYTTVIVTTIGYGDITVRTALEQCFAILLLIIGVIGFSFATGSLSSVLSSLDAKAGKLAEKMEILNDIKEEYRISYDLYRKLRTAVTYGHSKNTDDQQKFLNDLPSNLKVELAVFMHQDVVKSIRFFKSKSPHFIAFIMPFLRPVKSEQGTYIFKDGDPVDEIYFLSNGQAAYVLPQVEFNDAVYLIIESGYYFGEIDFIYVDEEGNTDGKRKFTAKALVDSELFVLSKTDLLKADEEFEDVISDLFANATHRLKKILKLMKQSKRFYKQLSRQRQEQIDIENQQMLLLQQQNGHSQDQGLTSKFLSPFLHSSGKGLEKAGQKETDQHAFIDDLKKKKLFNMIGNSKYKQDMLETMDEGQFDEMCGVDSSRDSRQPGQEIDNQEEQIESFDSDESQDGEDRRSSSERVDGEEDEGGDNFRYASNSSPDRPYEPEVDDVDSEGSKDGSPTDRKELKAQDSSVYSEGQSERVEETSDEDHKKSECTAYFHHGNMTSHGQEPQSFIHQVAAETFSGVLHEQGFDLRSRDSRTHGDTPSSSKQGGPFTFKKNLQAHETSQEINAKPAVLQRSSTKLDHVVASNLFVEEVKEHSQVQKAPSNTLVGTSQKGSAEASAQMGSILETSKNSQSDYSDEENEDILELDAHKKDLNGKEKKRSQSVFNDLKLGSQVFAIGDIKKQPTMMVPALAHRPVAQLSPMHLGVPKSRLEKNEELKFGSSGGTRGASSSPNQSPGASINHRTPSSRMGQADNEGVNTWKQVRSVFNKKKSTQQLLAPLKGPDAVNREFNKIKEMKNRRLSNKNDGVINATPERLPTTSSQQLVKQDSMTLTEVNHQLLRQIDTDNRNMYNQLISRIGQFESMLGEISTMMQDLNEQQIQTRESVQNLELATTGNNSQNHLQQQPPQQEVHQEPQMLNIDENLKAQIKSMISNMLRQTRVLEQEAQKELEK